MMIEQKANLYNGEVEVLFKENKDTGYHAYFITDTSLGIKAKRGRGVTSIIAIKDKSAPLTIWATETMRDYLIDNFLKEEKSITYDDLILATTEYKKVKDKAADIGSEIHDWIEKYIRYILKEDGYDEPKIPKKKEIKIGISAFLDWVNENHVEFISTERVIYSREHQFMGKMDIEAKVNGLYALIDIKTGNGIYNTVKMQTAAYAKADLEECQYSKKKKKYETRWALRLSKETESEYIERMKRKGKDVYPEYKVFEAREFPETEEDNIETDFKAFLACKDLLEWDQKTDFYKIDNAK